MDTTVPAGGEVYRETVERASHEKGQGFGGGSHLESRAGAVSVQRGRGETLFDLW